MTIARHELTRRWTLWLVALALSLVPPLMMDIDRAVSTLDRVGQVCAFALVVISWCTSFVIGMTLLGRALHDGRLAFYFTRPISGFAIAFGKLLGGLALIIGMELLVVTPMLGGHFSDWGSGGPIAAVVITAGFLAAGMVVGILARSRSRWFIADAVGGGVVTLIVIGMFDRINDAEMRFRFAKWSEARPLLDRVEHLLYALVGAAIVAMFIAVVTSIAVGRTDRVRVHAALSITLWSCLIAIALVGFGISQWGLQ